MPHLTWQRCDLLPRRGKSVGHQGRCPFRIYTSPPGMSTEGPTNWTNIPVRAVPTPTPSPTLGSFPDLLQGEIPFTRHTGKEVRTGRPFKLFLESKSFESPTGLEDSELHESGRYRSKSSQTAGVDKPDPLTTLGVSRRGHSQTLQNARTTQSKRGSPSNPRNPQKAIRIGGGFVHSFSQVGS